MCQSFTKVKWFLNDADLTNNSLFQKSFEFQENYLIFNVLSRNFAGEYKCHGKDFVTNRYFVATAQLEIAGKVFVFIIINSHIHNTGNV